MVDTTQFERRLLANRRKREAAETKLAALRDELTSLLAAGRASNVPVTTMARAAGISRQAAYEHLSRRGRA